MEKSCETKSLILTSVVMSTICISIPVLIIISFAFIKYMEKSLFLHSCTKRNKAKKFQTRSSADGRPSRCSTTTLSADFRYNLDQTLPPMMSLWRALSIFKGITQFRANLDTKHDAKGNIISRNLINVHTFLLIYVHH